MSKTIPEEEKTVRCIVCPTGCEIHVKNVKGELIIDGHTCNRGEEYAKDEFIAPKRILTSTMRVNNGLLPLIPVRTNQPVLKEQLNNILKEIAKKIVNAPIKMGDVLIENVLDLGVNIIASRDLIRV